MADWVQTAALRVDGVRVATLRLTLAVPALREAFCRRPLRLAWLFALSCAVYLPLSLLFPLWVLAIGPVVFGIPHLFASLRYSHRTALGNAAPVASYPAALVLFGSLYALVL